MTLIDGGARLSIEGEFAPDAPNREYRGLYARFSDLIARGVSEADGAPLGIVADALLIAETRSVAPFIE